MPFASDFGEDAAAGDEPLSFRREAQAATKRIADTLFRSGSPADEIIRAADDLEADLIVVGGQGKGTAGAILMGSVAYRVLSHAPALPGARHALGQASARQKTGEQN